MKARILFLGTGGDAITIGKQIRSSGGIILNVHNTNFHIDPGPGSLVMAKLTGFNLRENTAVFVTTNNLFNANDVNAVISAMTHDGLDKRGVLVCPLKVVTGKNAFLNEKYKNMLEKVIVVGKTKKLGVADIDVEIINIYEAIEEICAYKFMTDSFNLTYVPDTGFYPELPTKLEETDILILNVPDPRNIKREQHLNTEDAEKIINHVKPQLAVITGFGIKLLQADPLYEVREIQKNTGVQIIAAKDGMTINPMSFSATVRQSKLKRY